MNKFICQKKCIYRGRIYKEGEVLETEDTDIPRHFRLVEAAKTVPDAPPKDTAPETVTETPVTEPAPEPTVEIAVTTSEATAKATTKTTSTKKK